MSQLTHEAATWAIETLEEFWFIGVTVDYSTLNCIGEEGDLVYYEAGYTNRDGEEGTMLVTFRRIANDPILTHEIADYDLQEVA